MARYKSVDEKTYKYYADAIMPLIIRNTAEKGYIEAADILKKFGLPQPFMIALRDYMITNGYIVQVS